MITSITKASPAGTQTLSFIVILILCLEPLKEIKTSLLELQATLAFRWK